MDTAEWREGNAEGAVLLGGANRSGLRLTRFAPPNNKSKRNHEGNPQSSQNWTLSQIPESERHIIIRDPLAEFVRGRRRRRGWLGRTLLRARHRNWLRVITATRAVAAAAEQN